MQIPCSGVSSHLITTESELERYVKGKGEIGNYLLKIYKDYRSGYARSKVLWDISAIAYLINDSWVPTEITPSPILTDQMTWSFDNSRHFIRSATFVNRDKIF